MRKGYVILLFVVGLLFNFGFRAKNGDGGAWIYYQELGVHFYDRRGRDRQRFRARIAPDTLIKIHMLSRSGRSHVRIFKAGHLVGECYYADAYTIEQQPDQIYDRALPGYVDYSDHIHAVPDSTWSYYNAISGRLDRIVRWNNGVLVARRPIR